MKPRRFRLSLLNTLEILDIVCTFNDNSTLSLHLRYFVFSFFNDNSALNAHEKTGVEPDT
jgi:hypothetical protein